jgi:aquaporin NIP
MTPATATQAAAVDESVARLAHRRPGLSRRAAAEALAAFALVFAGCGAVVANAEYDAALGAVGVSLVFGLIIMVMVYATGHLSGAHINPAVTIAFTLSRHFPPRDAAAYVVAQLIGATVGAFVLLAVWPDQPGELGATIPSVGVGSAFVYELILSAFLMFVIMASRPIRGLWEPPRRSPLAGRSAWTRSSAVRSPGPR